MICVIYKPIFHSQFMHRYQIVKKKKTKVLEGMLGACCLIIILCCEMMELKLLWWNVYKTRCHLVFVDSKKNESVVDILVSVSFWLQAINRNVSIFINANLKNKVDSHFCLDLWPLPLTESEKNTCTNTTPWGGAHKHPNYPNVEEMF